MLRLDTFERDDAPWFMLDGEYWRAVVASRERHGNESATSVKSTIGTVEESPFLAGPGGHG